MNKNAGILGKKIGMTQVVSEDGTVTPCTVIDVTCTVVGKRTAEKDGYDALILGQGKRKAVRTSKPLAGQFKDQEAGAPQVVREFRCDASELGKYELGQQLKATDVFVEGQFLDIRGVSRGRGFTGVMRRHNFHGTKRSHGVHETKRHGGSIGTNMTPGRVLPGRRMAGQHGNKQISVLNQPIVKILEEKGLLLVRGGIPGSANGIVELRGANKKKNAGRPAA